MTSILKKYGACDSASNGKAVIEAVNLAWEMQAPYDLVFLDIGMPKMDGMSVLHEIRNLESKNNVPVENKTKIIMATSRADKDTIVQCMEEGCNDYIVKPVDKDMIAKKIARLFPQ